MPYVGPQPKLGRNREVDDISSGFNGSETNFTLQVGGSNVSPGTANEITVSLGGVIQNPGTDYTISASTITFTTAPANGLSFFAVVLGQGIDRDVGTPSDSSVTAAKLVNPLDLPDNHKIRFGTGNDLSIYHDSNHSYIQDTGTGNLKLLGSTVQIGKSDGSEFGCVFTSDGSIQLRHDNSTKFETTSSGVTVTGTVAATSYTGDGSSLTGVASTVADGCIYENSQTISNNYTITTNKNAMSAGPITVASGATLTIPSGSTYTIV